MKERTTTHATFVIERNYPSAPADVFAAFADGEKKQRWFTEGRSHEVEHFETEFRVGGRERAQYRFKEGTPFPGASLANETVYQDIVPGRRIVFAYTMAMNGKVFSASLATIELFAAEAGTDLVFTEQGAYFEGADGPQIREGGWRELLEHLASEFKVPA